jgi:IclR family pca regulon transcriptional regulator
MESTNSSRSSTSASAPSPRRRRATKPRRSDFVKSLERGLAVVAAFDADEWLTPSDIAAETGLTRAAVRRFLLTLADLGYVSAGGRGFRLAPRILELSSAYLRALALPDIALPHLRALVADVRESATLAVLSGDDIVYVEHVPGDRVLAVSVTIGGRDPAAATSLGRVLLAAQSDRWLDDYLARVKLRRYTDRTIVDPKRLRAALTRIRRQGWALVDEELEVALRAVAAPVRDETGTVVSAANVALHASRWQPEAITTKLLPRLLEATEAISAAVAARPPAEGPGDANEPTAPAERGNDFVQSLERGLAIICAFSGSTVPLTLSQVAVRSGLTRAAARRFLLTLADIGYVSTDGRVFWLSPKVLELGRGYLERVSLADVAQPHLRALAERVGEAATLAVLDGDDIVYVAHESTPRILSVLVSVGGRDPAWVTSLGRVLLAGLNDAALDARLRGLETTRHTRRTIRAADVLRKEIARVRSRGWALVDEEFEEGLRAVAVPLRDRGGTTIAALNIAVNASRWRVDRMRSDLLPPLLEAAGTIERDLAAARIGGLPGNGADR